MYWLVDGKNSAEIVNPIDLVTTNHFEKISLLLSLQSLKPSLIFHDSKIKKVVLIVVEE